MESIAWIIAISSRCLNLPSPSFGPQLGPLWQSSQWSACLPSDKTFPINVPSCHCWQVSRCYINRHTKLLNTVLLCNAQRTSPNICQMHPTCLTQRISDPKEVKLSKCWGYFCFGCPYLSCQLWWLPLLETFTSAQTYQANMPQHCSKVTKATQQPKTCEQDFISITANFPAQQFSMQSWTHAWGENKNQGQEMI